MSKPSGEIYLVENAVIDNTYQHTIDFKSFNEQFAYWSSLSKYHLYDYSYIRKQREYIHVAKSVEELDSINYVLFKPKDSGRWFFAFVTDKEYATETSAYLYFQIDVMQTYLFDFKINPSYVLQEHQDRWTAEHKPIYSRTEENLEYGSEYSVESAFKAIPTDDDKIKWFLFVCTQHKELSSDGDASTIIDNSPSPFIYYLVPYHIPRKDGVLVDWSNFNAGGEPFTVATLPVVYNFMLKSSFGNFVKEVILLPYNPFNLTVEGTAETGKTYDIVNNGSCYFEKVTLTEDSKSVDMLLIQRVPHNSDEFDPRTLAEMGLFEGLENAMPTAKQWEDIKANPFTMERDRRFESKLLTHPYRYNLLADFRNNPIILKNEYMTADKIDVICSQVLSFSCQSRYYLKGYRKDIEGRGISLIQELPMEQPVISDAYYTYMLQNKNQISANRTNTIQSGVTSVINGAIGGALAGASAKHAGVGALAGGVTTGLNAITSYQNLMRSENAKQKDISNLPDTVHSTEDCSFNLVDKNTYVCFYRYKIACEFEEQLAQYWNMYGYVCKRVKVPELKSRARFNYIKTIGANITGNVNQKELATIRAIFDNGITFWHYRAENFKPLDYTYENIEVKLV